MPIFRASSGSFKALQVTGSDLTTVSSSIYFKNLTTASQAYVLTYDEITGQIHYTASSAAGQGGTITSVTQGDGITITNPAGPTVTVNLNTGSTHFIGGVSKLTGSLLTTSSFNSWTGSASSQFSGTASYVTGSIFTSTNRALSASNALTASFVATASYVTGSVFNSTNPALSASYALTASFVVTASYVTGSIFTSTNPALSASYALSSSNALTASFVATASYVTGSIFTSTNPALSASYALTASHALNIAAAVNTSSLLLTASVDLNTITFTKGDNVSQFSITVNTGSGGGNAFPFNGNAIITGSLLVSGSSGGFSGITGSFTGSLTGSLFGTSSWAASASNAINAQTASFLPVGTYNITASWAQSASQALTASFVPNTFIQGGNSFGTTALLGTNDTQNLVFETSGSGRMFISSSGMIRIGTTSSQFGGDFTTIQLYAGSSESNAVGIRSTILYLYPPGTNTTSRIVYGSDGYTAWTLRNLSTDSFQIRSTPGSGGQPDQTILHLSSGSGGYRVGILNENPQYTLDVSGSTRITSSLYLPGLTTTSQLNVVTIDTASGQIYYTASSAIGGGGSGTPTPPGGQNTQIQFNSGSSFSGSSYFTFNYNSQSLQQGYNVTSSGLYQTVIGKDNLPSTSQSAFIIGDGGTGLILNPNQLAVDVDAGIQNPIIVSTSSIDVPGVFIPSSYFVDGTITFLSASVSETFTIIAAGNNGTTRYDFNLNNPVGYDYNRFETTLVITGGPNAKHNLLFASQSWFELDARNIFIKQLSPSTPSHIIGYNPSSGQLSYTTASVFPYSGSAIITGSLIVTGSTISTLGFTGSLFGTASWATNARTASFLPVGTYQITSSWAQSASQALTASYVTGSIFTSTNPVLSASFALTSSRAVTASFVATASYVTGSIFTSTNPVLSASYALSASFATTAITSSYPLSTIYDNLYSVSPPAGIPDTTTTNSIWIGVNAGNSVESISSDVVDSIFIGTLAGSSTSNIFSSFFALRQAGNSSTNSSHSIFIGERAGYNSGETPYSNFLGQNAGSSAASANNSNFLGQNAGGSAEGANNSNFLGQRAGTNTTAVSCSTLIGYQAGYATSSILSIGANNIIIGTNITLGRTRKDSINIGGLIFGTGSYATTTGNPFSGSANGRIGINVPTPTYTLDVSGSSLSGAVSRFSSDIVVATRSTAPSVGVEGQIVPAQSGSNYLLYVYIGGRWRSSSLF